MQEFGFIIWAVLQIWLKMFVKQFSGWISGKISFKHKVTFIFVFTCRQYDISTQVWWTECLQISPSPALIYSPQLDMHLKRSPPQSNNCEQWFRN